MKAIVYDGDVRFVGNYRLPRPGKGEVVVRVSLAGICATDLEVTRGYRAFRGVLGHEFVGRVESAGGAARHLAGRRVVGEINIGCGRCRWCLLGIKEHCTNRKVIGIEGRDGAFAEYLALPTNNLHEVDREVTDEEAVFTEPLAAAVNIVERAHIEPSSSVLVLGDGRLGLLAAMVLRLSGADVTVAGRNPSKLAIARSIGVSVSLCEELDEARLFDVVVEASGGQEGVETAIARVRARGRVVLKTTTEEGAKLNLTPAVVKEISLVGSRCGPFAPALRLLKEKMVDVKPLITAVFKPEMAQEAFARARQKEAIKILIDFRGR